MSLLDAIHTSASHLLIIRFSDCRKITKLEEENSKIFERFDELETRMTQQHKDYIKTLSKLLPLGDASKTARAARFSPIPKRARRGAAGSPARK